MADRPVEDLSWVTGAQGSHPALAVCSVPSTRGGSFGVWHRELLVISWGGVASSTLHRGHRSLSDL